MGLGGVRLKLEGCVCVCVCVCVLCVCILSIFITYLSICLYLYQDEVGWGLYRCGVVWCGVGFISGWCGVVWCGAYIGVRVAY